MSEMAPERGPVGRIGDDVYDPILVRCEGCGQSTLMCEVSMDHDGVQCCDWLCTHIHDSATLARYGLMER